MTGGRVQSDDHMRGPCFAHLHFMGANPTDPLRVWRRATRGTIDALTGRIEADIGKREKDGDNTPLEYMYSCFAVLAILVSEEFDAWLVALVDGDWGPFNQVHGPIPEGWDSHRLLAMKHFGILSMHWERACRSLNIEPVREVDYWMKRQWCQEMELLPRATTIGEEPRHRSITSRLYVSIDPFTPPEIAARVVSEILKEKQEAYIAETRADYEDYFGEDGGRYAEKERLRFDFRRSFPGNKSVRGGKTTFDIWLRSLRVYDMKRQGATGKEIASQQWHPRSTGTADPTPGIAKDKKRARLLIDAALCDIPLAAITIPAE